MRPMSTYRLQLHKGFRFSDLAQVVDYLGDLGVSHLYLSPIFESRPGSLHGYDCLDPNRISEERGGREGFMALMRDLGLRRSERRLPAGVILDIVPNHMAADPRNPYWFDVLDQGVESRYWKWFDIFESEDGKIILPFLAEGMDVESVLKQYPDSSRYSLENWRTGSEKVNYRRFFDISDLVSLRQEDPRVLRDTHSLLFELLEDQKLAIDGVRVDHIDGLKDPGAYLRRLKRRANRIWIEKILSFGETVPSDWSMSGTTGYEFSSGLNGLFVSHRGYARINGFWRREIANERSGFGFVIYHSKIQVLEQLFKSEVNRLVRRWCEAYPGTDPDRFKKAVIEITAHLPVYRTYLSSEGKEFTRQDRKWILEAFRAAKGVDRLILRQLKNGIMGKDRFVDWVLEWQQLSGPVMAKGLEDTAHYRYTSLVSLNEVGGEARLPHDPKACFLKIVRTRASEGLNTTSTHDSKRSEDVRARLNVLSEVPDPWIRLFEEWESEGHRDPRVDRATRYLLLQTLIGVWPLEETPEAWASIRDRVGAYMIKAVREAKVSTSWIDPREEYEAALAREVGLRIDEPGLRDLLRPFARRISYFGALNSLSTLTLKVLCPGIPDFYQGTELWDLSLVDPDNRRPVDYGRRRSLLAHALSLPGERRWEQLSAEWPSGAIKLWLTRELLRLRRDNAEFMDRADFAQVTVGGKAAHSFLAFRRRWGERWMVLLVPRLISRWADVPPEALRVPSQALQSVRLDLPRHAPRKWYLPLEGKWMEDCVAERALARIPVGVWMSAAEFH